jgi:SAM-dependent methyltransferase
MNQETLQYYEDNAEAFISGTVNADMSDTRQRFLKLLPENALILDFGCGSGRDTKAFLEHGYRVDAVDGSAELCRQASDYTGICVRQMLFQELDISNYYDGVWACASILHLSKIEISDVLKRISNALKPGGILYTSFKYGTFEGMRNNRYFTDFTETTLSKLWIGIDFLQIIDIWTTQDVRPGREEERWINLLARRV